MQTVLVFLGLAAVAAVMVMSGLRRSAKNRPVRQSIAGQRVLRETPVHVKYALPTGDWSKKNLALMELVVRDRSVQVTLNRPKFGSFMGSDWYFNVGASRAYRCDIHSSLGSEWIALESEADGKRIAVLPKSESLDEVWRSLRDIGMAEAA